MRYRLRTLHVLLGIGPPALAALWFWTVPAVVMLGTALSFWIMPKTLGAAIVIGVVNGIGFMLGPMFLQWGWRVIVARRAKRRKPS